jgi:hypothetical protein
MATILWVDDGGDASAIFALAALLVAIISPVVVGLLWRLKDRRDAKRHAEFC